MNNWFAARRQRMLRLKVRREGEHPFSPRIPAAAPVFEQCPRCRKAVSRNAAFTGRLAPIGGCRWCWMRALFWSWIRI